MTDPLLKDIKYFKGIGEKRAELFHKLGIFTAVDLLSHYPRRYEDWSNPITVREAAESGVNCCISVTVTEQVAMRRLRGGKCVFSTYASDGRDMLSITIWGNKYSAAKLKEGEEYLLYGRVNGTLYGYEISSPEICRADAGQNGRSVMGAKIHPIYPTVAGLPVKTVEFVALQSMQLLKDSSMFDEYLPQEIICDNGLIPLKKAVELIHFPKTDKDIHDARRRLAFDELFVFMLALCRMKDRKKSENCRAVIVDKSDEFVAGLPFKPTNAQLRAISEAAGDMASGKPMNRLLQGDVGSGKTAVAAAAIYNAAKSGVQSALMAPTELLAVQHFETMKSFLQPFGIHIALLTGKTTAAERRDIYAALESGYLDLLIGTHALFGDKVKFKELGLVITDEQHRFGVEQRSAIAQKGNNAHLYVMSATPIPRTLALMIYGELDLSVLDEKPANRKPIRTTAVNSSYRPRIYNFIEKAIAEGHQAYIVCPAVEENEESGLNLESATEYYEKLSGGQFAGYKTALLHGKMKPKEKEAVMAEFAAGEVSLLITTTVIEVGIDVPNATVMVIENAERFGLSQLHQLRGRIGRGDAQSDCILISDSKSETAKERLAVMKRSNDGFYIADEDLKMRGAGDFFGHRQSGLPEFRIADLCDDGQLVAGAKLSAERLIAADPQLDRAENMKIRKRTDEMLKALAEGIN